MREFYFVFREPNDLFSSSFGPVDVHEILEDAKQEIKKLPQLEFKIFKVAIEEVKEKKEVSLTNCKNPDCPVGCPDSHCMKDLKDE